MEVKDLLNSLSDRELRDETKTTASNIGAVMGSRITAHRILLEVLIQERIRRMELFTKALEKHKASQDGGDHPL